MVKFLRLAGSSDTGTNGSSGEVDLGLGKGGLGEGCRSRRQQGFGSFERRHDTDGPMGNGAPGECTVGEAVDSMGFGWFQVRLSAIAGLAWMADSMEMMLLSILSPALACVYNLSTTRKALISAVASFGSVCGAPLWGVISDKYGRRSAVILASAWLCYFGLLSSFAPTYNWLIFLRFLTNIGISSLVQALTLYAEFLTTDSRGAGLMALEVFYAFGAMFEACLCLIIMPTLGYRYVIFFTTIPAIIFLIISKWLPESARYHITCGNQEKARAVLEEIGRLNNKPMLDGRLTNEEAVERGSFRDLFVTREIAISTGLLVFAWLILGFAYFGLSLLTPELILHEQASCSVVRQTKTMACFDECKTLSTGGYVALIVTTSAELPGLLLAAFLVDIIGRKKTLALLLFVFSLFAALLIICWPTRALLIVIIFGARASISAALQSAFVYTSELYPTNTRALGLGCCQSASRVGAVISPFFAQVLLAVSRGLSLGIFAGLGLLAVVAVLLLPIETKGREMQSYTEPEAEESPE